MHLLKTLDDLRRWRETLTGPLGLVPTMGYLHAGHASLVARARAECAHVLVTVFVNPTQFGPNEDFARYPRDLDRDRAIAAGADALFAPDVAAVYPPGFATGVTVAGPALPLEGAARPGHFGGVATVVARLFGLTRPERAYFGEKDYQQLQVIRRMTTDLALPVAVVGCPIVREADGLAMSSRNVYLTPDERPRAAAVHRGIEAARAAAAAGERDARRLEAHVAGAVTAAGLAIDYVKLADGETLEPIGRLERPARVLVAARLGRVRLIDNAEVAPRGGGM